MSGIAGQSGLGGDGDTKAAEDALSERLAALRLADHAHAKQQQAMTTALERAADAFDSFSTCMPGRDPRLPPAAAVAAPLRTPAPEKYSGNRERTLEFVCDVEGRLSATGQMDTAAGLTHVQSCLTGLAATWLRFYRIQHRTRVTWVMVKDDFLKAFALVNETALYQERLTSTKQSGSVEEYIDRMMEICMHLPGLSEEHKVNQIQSGCCRYLKDLFVERELKFAKVEDLVQYVLSLVGRVDRAKLAPDADAVIAAVYSKPAGPRKDRRFEGSCWTCGERGHRSPDCPDKASKGKGAFKKAAPNPPARGKAPFGKYKAKVHNIEAEASEEGDLSDEELRSGKELA